VSQTLDPIAAAEYLRLARVMLRAQHVVEAGGGDLADHAYAHALEDWLQFGVRHPELLNALVDESAHLD
jgi:hypothetical protein